MQDLAFRPASESTDSDARQTAREKRRTHMAATKRSRATARVTKASITSTPFIPLDSPLTLDDVIDLRTTTELRIAEQAKLAGQPITIAPASLARADADEAQAVKAAKPKAPKPVKAAKPCHTPGCENPRHVQSGGAVMSLCLPCFQTYHAAYALARKAKTAAEPPTVAEFAATKRAQRRAATLLPQGGSQGDAG
jgi:hypothetical protein